MLLTKSSDDLTISKKKQEMADTVQEQQKQLQVHTELTDELKQKEHAAQEKVD